MSYNKQNFEILLYFIYTSLTMLPSFMPQMKWGGSGGVRGVGGGKMWGLYCCCDGYI